MSGGTDRGGRASPPRQPRPDTRLDACRSEPRFTPGPLGQGNPGPQATASSSCPTGPVPAVWKTWERPFANPQALENSPGARSGRRGTTLGSPPRTCMSSGGTGETAATRRQTTDQRPPVSLTCLVQTLAIGHEPTRNPRTTRSHPHNEGLRSKAMGICRSFPDRRLSGLEPQRPAEQQRDLAPWNPDQLAPPFGQGEGPLGSPELSQRTQGRPSTSGSSQGRGGHPIRPERGTSVGRLGTGNLEPFLSYLPFRDPTVDRDGCGNPLTQPPSTSLPGPGPATALDPPYPSDLHATSQHRSLPFREGLSSKYRTYPSGAHSQVPSRYRVRPDSAARRAVP